MSNTPIAAHALLSDCHGAALVDRAGSVEWWCAPRFDSPSLFGALLGKEAGRFLVRPVGAFEPTRRYADGTLVLETTFRTDTGTVVLQDALAMADGVRGHDLGMESPHVLLRTLTCTKGDVEVEVDFAPCYEYGLTTPVMEAVDGGVIARGGPATLRLSTCMRLDVADGHARGHRLLQAGNAVCFAVEHASSWAAPPAPWSCGQVAARVDDTALAWQSWQAEHQRYEGPYAGLVQLSGKVLQALTYQPTGAIVAAPTTSLPETVGGTRNWDYRFSWVRDASFTLDALWVAACPDEAHAFFRYLRTVASTFLTSGSLQIMFGVQGERDLSERTLDHLEGWKDSAPVRVGNGAWRQRQLDVYGELLAAAYRLRDQLGDLDPLGRRFLVALADAAARSWRQPDQGIWEVRGQPQHYVYSKLMCWAALDRAIAMARTLRATDAHVMRWRREREAVRDAILREGWNDRVGSFTQVFGGDDLDASNLVIPAVGFLPANDPRVLATIAATENTLTDRNGLVCRYTGDDGLEGGEGAFLLCTFWLAEALARANQVPHARTVFERAISYRNDVDLLAEEVDEVTGDLLGNFPQALSHIGLVNAAWALRNARTGQHRDPDQEPSTSIAAE